MWPAIGLVNGTFTVFLSSLSSLSSLRLNAVQQKQVAQLPPLGPLCGVNHTVHVVQQALCHLQQLYLNWTSHFLCATGPDKNSGVHIYVSMLHTSVTCEMHCH